jgi:hypothetical protein
MAATNVKILKIFSRAIMLFENESFQCHFIYCPRNSTLFNLECSEAALIFGRVITYTQYCLPHGDIWDLSLQCSSFWKGHNVLN